MKHSIIWRMIDTQNIRRLVKLIDKIEEDQGNDDFLRGFGFREGVCSSEVIGDFCTQYSKYSQAAAKRLYESGIERGYIQVVEGLSLEDQRIRVHPNGGRALLSHSGYVNELAGSIGKVSPFLTWLVSIAALVVSVVVAIYTTNNP